MKKRDVWACEHGCDLSRVPCEHLEKLLPQMRDRKVVRVDVANHTVDVFQVYHPKHSLKEFVDLMRSFGFTNDWDLELLTAKYFYGISNRNITKEQNFCSPRTTDRRLRHLHALLVERGFKPRRRT